MAEQPDRSVLDAQRSRRDSALDANTDMFGLEPSESVQAAIPRFLAEGVGPLLAFGAAKGRDTFPLSGAGFAVTSADFSEVGLARIRDRCPLLPHVVLHGAHQRRAPQPRGRDPTAPVRAGSSCTPPAPPTTPISPAECPAATTCSNTWHFFSPALVEELAQGFEILDRFEFEEGALPRRLRR